MLRPRLHGEHPDPAAAGQAHHRAGREDAQQGGHRAADAAVAAARGEGAPVGEHRAVRDEVEDEVVRPVPGEVVAAVVDDLVGAERAHEVELAGVVDPRDVRTRQLRELDGERPGAAARPVEQHAAPRPGAGRALHARSTPDCGSVEASTKPSDGGFRASAVSGATANSAKPPFRPRLSPYTSSPTENRVTPGRPPSRGRRCPSPSTGRAGLRRPPKRAYAGRSDEGLPVGQVERGRDHLDEHLAGARESAPRRARGAAPRAGRSGRARRPSCGRARRGGEADVVHPGHGTHGGR